MSPLKRPIVWLRRELVYRIEVGRRQIRRFGIVVDRELVSDYQKFYYPMIFLSGMYLAFVADEPTMALAVTLGRPFYLCWLGLHLVCPWMTLLGRRIYAKAKTTAPGEPNGALGAAWMQFAGDGGVWGAILIYVFCLFNTAYWGQAIYPSFYLLMGVPGGFMFTYRSFRRLRQINRRAQVIAEEDE